MKPRSVSFRCACSFEAAQHRCGSADGRARHGERRQQGSGASGRAQHAARPGGGDFEQIGKDLEANAYETAAQVRKAIQQMTDAETALKNAEKELAKMVSHSQMMENRYKEVRLKAGKARDEYTRLKATYDKEFEKQTAQLEELKKQRAEVGEQVDPKYMERYKAVRGQCSPAMARLNNDQCSGCNMSLPSAVAKQLQGSDEIIECENCGRILYMPDAQ